jgi:hypothetical protein
MAKAKAGRRVLCKHLDGKPLFTAMLHLYAVILRELRESFLPEQHLRNFASRGDASETPSEEQVKK